MKNITVSVPDELYTAARTTAAERGTTVTALVREYLQNITPSTDAGRDLLELLDEIGRKHPGFRASDNIPRDQLHDRAALRRH